MKIVILIEILGLVTVNGSAALKERVSSDRGIKKENLYPTKKEKGMLGRRKGRREERKEKRRNISSWKKGNEIQKAGRGRKRDGGGVAWCR